MIDAAPSPPYPALVLQIFRDAKYMLDVRVAPLLGALVMTNEAWNKIDAGRSAGGPGRGQGVRDSACSPRRRSRTPSR